MENNEIVIHNKRAEAWTVTLIDTGENTMTGGRLKRVKNFLKDEDIFCFTYGDGLSNLNINDQIEFHRNHGKLATITAVQPPGRYGALILQDSNVIGFKEKPPGDGGWINGGFFILSPNVLDLIENDSISWENEPLQELAKLNQLKAFQHRGFWHPMDTLRDKNYLEKLWHSEYPPWKNWA